MNIKVKQKKIIKNILIILSIMGLATQVWSQSTSSEGDPDEENVDELTPFEIVDSAGGYSTRTTTVGTRSHRDITENIQTVNVLTQDFLEDTGTLSVGEATQYISNANIRNRENSLVKGDTYILRGFENNAAFVDGIEVGAYGRDMVGYERVEVIKGVPSAALGGGGGSGTMNFILKKPNQRRSGGKLKVIGGSFDQIRVEADYNYVINQDMAARLIFAYQEDGEFLDSLSSDGIRFYPSFRWKISEKMDVLYNGEFLLSDKAIGSFGQGFTVMPAKFRKLFPELSSEDDLITNLDLPWDFHISPGGSKANQDDTYINKLQFTYSATDNLNFRQVLFHKFAPHSRRVFWGGGNFPDFNPNDPNNENGVWKRLRHRTFDQDSEAFEAVGDVAWDPKFEIGNFPINLFTQAGWNYSVISNADHRKEFPVKEEFEFFNLADPNFEAFENQEDALEDDFDLLINNSSTNRSFDIYINQEIKLLNDRLKLLYGWRREYFDNTFENFLNGETTIDRGSAPPSERYGGSFRVSDELNFYGSKSTRSDGVVTSIKFNAGLVPDDPRLNETISSSSSIKSKDIGMKGRLFGGRLFYSLGYFEIVRTGTLFRFSTDLETPPGSGNFQIVTESFFTDGDTVEGWEGELIGNITDRLALNVTYGIIDSVQPDPTSDDPEKTQDIRFIPEWNSSLFVKYDMRNTNDNGFSFRGGLAIIGEIPNVTLSGFGATRLNKTQTKVDLGVSYKYKNYQLDAMVKNVFDDTFQVVRLNKPRHFRISGSWMF